MSRSYGSYDADWQRRKSVLIRSLFHDIPILSPVEEESDDSSQQHYVPTQEVFPSPPRPYSPLPPLIIEKVPISNKHDEPEEYYSKLYKKIKILYKKLFIEKRNFSSIDYGSNYSDTSNDDSDGNNENLDFRFLETNSPDNGNFDSIIENREARRSSASTKSSGYGADFESMDTAIIDVVNFTASNEDDIMISDEEESDGKNIDGDGIINEDYDSSSSSDNKESRKERIDDPELSGEEESHHYIIDDHEMIEGEDYNEPEDEQSYAKESLDNEDIEEHKLPVEISQTAESDTIRTNDPVFRGREKSHHSSIDDDEETECEESNEIGDELQPKKVKEPKSKEFEKTMSEDGNEFIESNVEPMERDVETSDSSEGPAYRQITTAAMIHFDGSSDAGERESRVYEDSDNSVILPTRFRRVVVSRNVDVDDRIEVLTVLDENADSKTTPSFYTDESETTEEDFEEVTTLQIEAKEEGIIEKRTPQADTPEEGDEEMSTPQPESADEDVEGMESPQPAARGEETEEMGIPLPKVTEEHLEAMDTPRLHAPGEDDEEMSSPQPGSADTALEGMGSPQPAARDKDTEEMGIPLTEATDKDVEEMGTPHAEFAEEDIEGMGCPQPAARDEETKATEVDEEEMGSSHSIEQIRTPRPDLSHGTIPTTHRSHSESTSEHTGVPQELTTLTSSTQDGAEQNMSELQTSNDMNEVLTSIFNESRTIDGGTPISGSKRKLVDKSVQAVQTSRVTWDEMRANFFVGTPKIFRLCACADHICY